jgi:D-inositol-3-phosphate glycosyltransferase
MRVCVVSYHSSPMAPVGSGKSGGMSIVIRSLYERLARYADIDIFVKGSKRIIERGPRLKVIQIEQRDTSQFAEEIMEHHGRHRYDLIHTHYWSSGIVGLHVQRVMKIPWLHTMHTVEVLKTIRRDHTRIEIEEEIMRFCDLVVSPTEQESLAIKALYPDVEVLVIPHGVDTERFTPSRNGHKNVLFVGRVDPIKGIHFLVDALKEVRDEIGLILVGGPSKGAVNLEAIQTYAAGLPVDFVGQVKHDRLAEFYSKTAMLVVPSHYESFGLVGLEAMASGRPVVGFSHTGLQETVGDDAGILVKMGVRGLATAIETLSRDHELRQRMGRIGRRKALAYDWSLIARRYKRLYERVIKE